MSPNRKIGDSTFPAIGFGAMGTSAYYGQVQAHRKRADIFLCTKFGSMPDMTINGSPEHVRDSAEVSLAKLGVDSIDLYYLHRLSIRPSRSTKIHLLAPARELGVKIVAYAPLGRGLFTGQYIQRRELPQHPQTCGRLKEIGAKYDGATAGKHSLAWLLAQSDDIITIPGTKIKYLQENITAGSLKLSAEDVQAVREVDAKVDAAQGSDTPSRSQRSYFARHPLWEIFYAGRPSPGSSPSYQGALIFLLRTAPETHVKYCSGILALNEGRNCEMCREYAKRYQEPGQLERMHRICDEPGF
ncbi:NADP-dependent oxidoreductase domain-containing protein [Mycena epipterygia]|nr:NADP-dependent oxidoreductase domain-containing protein [Mycena epipterygia]